MNSVLIHKTWFPDSCNGRKHRCKHVSHSVLMFQAVLIHVNTLIATSQASPAL